MAWREESTKYHNMLADAMVPYSGATLTKSTIEKVLAEKYPELKEKLDWVLPSDHCVNRTNKGACYCAETEKAIFERVGWGKYRIL